MTAGAPAPEAAHDGTGSRVPPGPAPVVRCFERRNHCTPLRLTEAPMSSSPTLSPSPAVARLTKLSARIALHARAILPTDHSARWQLHQAPAGWWVVLCTRVALVAARVLALTEGAGLSVEIPTAGTVGQWLAAPADGLATTVWHLREIAMRACDEGVITFELADVRVNGSLAILALHDLDGENPCTAGRITVAGVNALLIADVAGRWRVVLAHLASEDAPPAAPTQAVTRLVCDVPMNRSGTRDALAELVCLFDDGDAETDNARALIAALDTATLEQLA